MNLCFIYKINFYFSKAEQVIDLKERDEDFFQNLIPID